MHAGTIGGLRMAAASLPLFPAGGDCSMVLAAKIGVGGCFSGSNSEQWLLSKSSLLTSSNATGDGGQLDEEHDSDDVF